MTKKLTVVGLCSIAALLFGAVVVEVAEETQKSVVSNWSDCAAAYLSMRTQMPPVPLPRSAEELIAMAEEGDFSFQADPHWYIHQPQTLYVTADSELAKQLKLPATLVAMEDLRLGDIIFYSIKNEEKDLWKPEVSFTAPVLMDETDPDFAALSAKDQSKELSFQLSSRRIVGKITLLPASALTELLTRSTLASTESVAEGGPSTVLGTGDLSGMTLLMSAPPEHTNDLWLSMEGPQSGGTQTLNVFAPESMSNIEVFACSDLCSGFWTRIATNINPTGPTNPAVITVSGPDVRFCRARTAGDEDGDGLTDGQELYVTKTALDNPDSDGDGYSDGPQWPAGYSGTMRGVNDAFPNDAAAWRDTDGDGLPNEVVGTSTLVEDLDDDGDGTNDFPSTGIWLSAAEVSALSTNNVQWENLVQEADRVVNFVEIANENDWADVVMMAKALVYARTGDENYRTDVIDACRDAIGTETNGSSLALGHNVGGFVIAADLVKLPRNDDMQFRDWLRGMLTEPMSDGKSLQTAHETFADNRGTFAGGARAAIAAYLQDWDELDRVARVFKGWVGDRSSYAGFTYDTLEWQADTNSPVGINPAGATIKEYDTNGVVVAEYNVDGVLPVAQAEGGSFDWPPRQADDAYEALQGALLQAVILDRAGHDVWTWEDQAMVRAYNWAEEEADSPAEEEDTWQPFVVNSLCASADLAAPAVSEHGENIAPTDWTHAVRPDADGDGLPDGWELRYGLDPYSDQGHDGADGDPDGDHFSNLHEYRIGTNPSSDISEGEFLIFDELFDSVGIIETAQTFYVESESLAAFGTNCLKFVMIDHNHYYPSINVGNHSFTHADEFRFYIRTASGVQTEPFKFSLIEWFGSPDNMDSLDIQSYLYDLDGNPSTNITEQYKLVKVPYADMRTDETNQFGGAFRSIQFKITSEQAQHITNLTFYIDRISLQDTTGLTVEHIEPFDACHLEVTCSDRLDFISARDLTNHVITGLSGQLAVTDVGLRSWVEQFAGSADSPIVKYYIDLELADPLVSGQTYTYSNSVQDISGNFPLNGTIDFSWNETNVSSSIKVNQVGWLPEATKIAYVGNYLGDLGPMHLDTDVSHTATIQDAGTGMNVYTAQLVRAEEPDYFNSPDYIFSGEEVWRIDFSALQTPGTYRVCVPGVGCSYDFEIGSNIYADVYYDCMRSLWYQRSGICMTNPAYSGIWAREGDLQQNTNAAFYHNSIYDKSYDLYAGEEIGGYADFTGGWYDAADYNKYTKSGADAVNLLLTMYELRPERFADSQLNLPESGNGIPDVLDEAKWELDWIAKMVSANGAAFNKCTYEMWPGGMPSEQDAKLWVITKTTRATAAACAILAKAARIYAPYDTAASTLYSNKAVLAWQCLTNFPDAYPIPAENEDYDDYGNPDGTTWVAGGVTNIIPGIHTGAYFSTNDITYRVWAGIEMYRLTERPDVHQEFSNIIYRAMSDYGVSSLETTIGRIIYGSMVPGKGDGYSSSTRGYVMLYDYAVLTNGPPVFEEIRSIMADKVISIVNNSWLEEDLPYDFEIKSYSNIGLGEGSQVRRPYGYILAYELTGDTNWLERARINLDWPLGANPLSQTYITGIGDAYPMHPHNKFDHADGIDEPVPGYNIYGLAEDLEYRDYYASILENSYPAYRTDMAGPGEPFYPVARKYVDTWESVSHGEFVIDDLARTAMVFAYFSSTNAP